MGFRDKLAEAKEEAERQKQLKSERKAAGVKPDRIAPSARPTMRASFEGVRLENGRLSHKTGSGPVKGAHARVESGADVRQRITATRVVMGGGIGGILFKKQAGHVFLTIEHEKYEIVVEVPVKKDSDARKFATKVNNAARS